MQIPRPAELIARVRALPSAEPLFARLDGIGGVHLVGGAVRDILLGLTPPDLDLVVESDVSELIAHLGGELRTHDRFGTATVSLAGHTYDIARARRETYAHPGALPDVEPAPLAVDLTRRDFTVNAAAIELSGPEAGTLRSVLPAVDDLLARRLRVLHDRSFVDDPTRLLRLVRYAARLGFGIEEHTRALVRAAIADDALSTVSGARIGAELRLMAREPDPVPAIEGLADVGIELVPGFGLRDPGLARRAIEELPADGDPGVLVIGVAAQGVGRETLGGWLADLAFTASARDAIVEVATRSSALAAALGAARAPSEIARAVGDLGPETVAVAAASGDGEAAREWRDRLRHVRLEIDGGDLIAAGIPQGPAIGRGLRAALDAKLDGRIASRDAELAEALRAAR